MVISQMIDERKMGNRVSKSVCGIFKPVRSFVLNILAVKEQRVDGSYCIRLYVYKLLHPQ